MKLKRKEGMRWHPLFIRWCLNLSRVSPKAYEVMKESGIYLPTRRTTIRTGYLQSLDLAMKWIFF